jgi:hypothetical protein
MWKSHLYGNPPPAALNIRFTRFLRSVLESRQAPYSLVWQPQAGQHTLELRAADLAGNISEAERVRFEVVK